MRPRVSSRASWLAAGLLAIGMAGCDGGRVAVVDDGSEQSEAMQAFLETSDSRQVVGAHRPTDPHANLGPEQLARVALEHFQEARTEIALEALASALGRYPESALLLGLRASIHLHTGQPSLALADLNRAVAIDPHDPGTLTNRAQALRRFERIDDARRDLDDALELDPEFLAALFNRGSLAFESGDFAAALADFDRCIELQPEVPAAWFNRASTHEALGARERAIADLNHFLTLAPPATAAQMARDLLAEWGVPAS